MEEVQLEQIIEKLQSTVKETVNGKIDRMSLKLDEHVVQHQADMEKMTPVIEAFENVKGFKRILTVLGVVLGSVAGLAVAITQIISVVSPPK